MQERPREPSQSLAREEPSAPPAARRGRLRVAALVWTLVLTCGFTAGLMLSQVLSSSLERERHFVFEVDEPEPLGPQPAQPVRGLDHGEQLGGLDVEEPVGELPEESSRELAEQVVAAAIQAPQATLDFTHQVEQREVDRLEKARRDKALAAQAREQAHGDVAAAKQLLQDREFGAARVVALDCVTVTPGNAECHKLLGTIYAKLDEPEEGAAEYRAFLKAAGPTHPDYVKVQQILEVFERRR